MRAYLRGPRALLAFALLLSCLPAITGQAVQLRPARGSPEIGVVRSREGDRVEVNVYRTKVAGVTHGTKSLVLDPQAPELPQDPAEVRFWRAIAELRSRTAPAAEWMTLANTWQDAKRPDLAQQAKLEGLVSLGPTPALVESLGKSAEELLASDARLAPGLTQALEAVAQLEDHAERARLWKADKERAAIWPQHWMERVLRSQRIPKGRSDRVALTLRASEAPGATYCRFVPSGYDPTLPTPLVIGLHGGGPAGKKRDRVAGNGESAMNFYSRLAEASGWIVLCPTALRASWAQRANDPLIEALVDEAAILFNVDRHRIYLVGHSMGGFGTWHHGPRLAERWAAIAPAAGGGRPNLQRLADSKTGVHLHHGADDAVVGVGTDRSLGEQMRQRAMDFVYCELPNSGHGYPGSVRREVWEFLSLRRLALQRGRSYRTAIQSAPSFLEAPTSDEIRFFGDPRKLPSEPTLKDLAKSLELGGGRASEAAAALAAMGDRKAMSALTKALNPKRFPYDVRRSAALALGELGEARAAKPLAKALRDPRLEVLGAVAESLGKLDAKGAPKQVQMAAGLLEAAVQELDQGGRWAFQDYTVLMTCGRGIARGAGALSEGAGLPALERIERLLMTGLSVPQGGRIRYDPLAALRGLGLDMVAAAAATGPSAKPLLGRLAGHAIAEVAAAAREAGG